MPQAGVSLHRSRASLRRHDPDQVRGCVLSPSVGHPGRATLTERSGRPRAPQSFPSPARAPRPRRRQEAASVAATIALKKVKIPGGEQAAEHVREDPAVAQVLALARRVEPDAGGELLSSARTVTSRASPLSMPLDRERPRGR